MNAYRQDASEDRTLLIVASMGDVIAFRRDNGVVAWRFELTTPVFGLETKMGGMIDLAISHGRVYLGFRDRVVCLDYLTGNVLGQIPLPMDVKRPAFLIDGEHLYCTAGDRVICFTLNGQIIWQTPHNTHLVHGPAMGVPGNVRQGDETA